MTHAGTGITRPNVARTYDYLLGGIESYTADREQAAELLRTCPSLGIVALENRYLLARAVTWAAGQGMTQFIDLGAGMPVKKAGAGVLEDIHATAQAASPSARVAYVDDDPLVLARSRVFRAPARGVAVIAADLTDPDSVLADLGLRAVIDLAQPACFIFGLALSLVPATDARDVVAGYLHRAAPGSCVVISCGRCDDEALWAQLSKAYTRCGGSQSHASRDREVPGRPRACTSGGRPGAELASRLARCACGTTWPGVCAGRRGQEAGPVGPGPASASVVPPWFGPLDEARSASFCPKFTHVFYR